MKNALPERYYDSDRNEMLGLVPLEARRILEVGCANGRFSALIKQRQPAEIWGIEMEPGAAVAAAERLDKVMQGDIRTLLPGLPDAGFDCVICNDVLEHIADPEPVIAGLAAKLTASGVIVASIPNIRYLPVLYELLVLKDFKYRDWGVLDRTHLRFFTRRSIRRMFTTNGYDVVTMRGIQMPQVSRAYKLAFLLAEVLTLGYYGDCRFIQFGCVARRSIRT